MREQENTITAKQASPLFLRRGSDKKFFSNNSLLIIPFSKQNDATLDNILKHSITTGASYIFIAAKPNSNVEVHNNQTTTQYPELSHSENKNYLILRQSSKNGSFYGGHPGLAEIASQNGFTPYSAGEVIRLSTNGEIYYTHRSGAFHKEFSADYYQPSLGTKINANNRFSVFNLEDCTKQVLMDISSTYTEERMSHLDSIINRIETEDRRAVFGSELSRQDIENIIAQTSRTEPQSPQNHRESLSRRSTPSPFSSTIG